MKCLPMLKVPSMSSNEFIRWLEKGGAVFVRQGTTNHAMYSRIVEGRKYSNSVQMGKKHWILYILQKGFQTIEIYK